MVRSFRQNGRKRYGVNQKTVAKWKHRSTVADLPIELMGWMPPPAGIV
jgi:hypothetical protein